MALKKVALRRLEDGIPNQALREIKALQEIEDSQYVSRAGALCWGSCPYPLTSTLGTCCRLLPHPSLLPFLSTCSPLFPPSYFIPHSLPLCSPTYFFVYLFIYSLTSLFAQNF